MHRMFDKVSEALKSRGFAVSRFGTAAEAAEYLNRSIDNKTVGFGGSVTLQEMGLYETLGSHNQVVWHWQGGPELRREAMTTQVYLTSVNGLAETGELINIDGNGNRVSSTAFGHQEVYFVVGTNKIAPDLDSALWRARNVAAPKRAQSMGRKTPCAVKADRCYDCQSPDRICRVLSVLWAPPLNHPHMEVILIGQELGM